MVADDVVMKRLLLVEAIGPSCGTQLVGIPSRRVRLDIIANAGQLSVAAHDPLVVIALPKTPLEAVPAKIADAADVGVGGDRLERPDDVAKQRASCGRIVKRY